MLRLLKDRAKPLIKQAIITAGLEATPLLANTNLFSSARGQGAIFTLHHVRPNPTRSFQPNDILDITPEFLETAIVTLGQAGYEFIRLEDIPARLVAGKAAPFACFTLDDGYRDNAEFAAPVFSKHGVPFTIFLTKGFIDVTHSMWWETTDALLNTVDRLEFDFGSGAETLAAGTLSEKLSVFNRVADFINSTDEAQAVAALDAAALTAGIDPLGITRALTMREDELKTLLTNPLVSYGAHTVSHRGLVRLSTHDSQLEIAASVERVARITGEAPASFAYTYGDARSVAPRERALLKSLGVDIAVTTRPGTITSKHESDMTALPRISLNGNYQKARYVRALASGIPFKVMG
jgi:peptidoglycan/xylan/chitin deacetylase (PgdA/CDA1 family)